MFKYELKKIFSKRMNKVLLAAVLVMTVIYSGMAIGEYELYGCRRTEPHRY